MKSFDEINSFRGELQLPGDKSISHRAVMFSSLAEGESEIYNLLESEDVNSTIGCFRAMGVEITKTPEKISVKGAGFKKLRKPEKELDCGNSGTTSRLISGILAAQDFETKLVGDESLSKRPMDRIINPLKEMGAEFESVDNKLPLTIKSSSKLRNIEYTLPVASAQVKSAVLLLGLHLDEETKVIENVKTRNHTENLLNLPVQEEAGKRIITVSKKNYPENKTYNVPSDISTAAFFMVAASIAGDSEIKIKNVLLNETRNGIISVLKEMNADIEILNSKEENGEKSGDVLVRSGKLRNIRIKDEIIPNIIDEIPVLSLAGIFADGDFMIRNAGELRVKECDRINALVVNYKRLGLDVEEFEDGFKISGKITNSEAELKSFGDHRIAMTMAILAMVTENNYIIDNFDCVKISNPHFLEQVESIGS